MTEQGQTGFCEWAILELMGHRRLGGLVTEQQIAGVGMIRIDVAERPGQPGFTQFYAPSALYCLTPTTEEIARAVGHGTGAEPVQRWELAASPEWVQEGEYPNDDDDGDDDDGSCIAGTPVDAFPYDGQPDATPD